MELYLNREKINHVRNVLNTRLTQEETMEMIVPDALPDILRIICVDATVLIRGKDADIGRVSVSGIAAMTVVYAPEGVGGVRRINAEIPFTIAVAESEIIQDSSVIARVTAITADASIVNPRKFVLRVDLLAELSCYNGDELSISTDIELAEDSGIELLRESCEVCIPMDVREKSFVISDELTLPNGSPEIGDILRSIATVTAEEAKVVGNKLIFRGNTNISLLYNPADDDDLCSVILSSEFSQIMELENISEDCDFDIVLMLTGAYIESGGMDSSDGRMVGVELHVVAQCVAAERKTITFISDVYSTKFSLMHTAEEVEFEHREAPAKLSSVFRGVLETPGDVSRVIAVNVATGTVERGGDDSAVMMRSPLYVTCVYIGDDGRIMSALGRFEAEATGEMRQDGTYAITAACIGEIYTAAAGNGIELRIPVDFTVTEARLVVLSALSEISYDEEEALDTSKMPSLMISKTSKGDTLWKLAKKHHSTAVLILTANGLESEEEIKEGQMLIVPKKR